MGRTSNKLTATAVQKLRRPGRYPDGAGLSLVISGSGKRSWAYRYQLRGRPREMTLGDAAIASLAEARQHAADARRLIAGGVDPLDARRDAEHPEPAEAAVTFGEAARRYIGAHEVAWRNPKHRAQWRSTIETHCGAINDLPCDVVTTREVLEVLMPIWNSIPDKTASRLRGRIEQVLAYAAVQGWRSEEAANPATGLGVAGCNLRCHPPARCGALSITPPCHGRKCRLSIAALQRVTAWALSHCGSAF